MKCYTLSHLADHTLLRELVTLVAQDRALTAELLAHLAEVDARKLYLPAAYPSMYAYCVGELHLCEQAAFKRILAARTARRFPAIFDAVAQGRLHLSAVVLLAPHLTEDTAEELLAAATHKSKAAIEQLLAERHPRPDVLGSVEAVPASSVTRSTEPCAPGRGELSPGKVGTHATPGPVLAPQTSGHVSDRPKVAPLGSQSFAVQFTMSRRAHDKLRYAQELLGHQVPSGDLAEVFERALDALIERLEKRKFAASPRPRSNGQCPSKNPRHIPAQIKRAVWERDRGQCSFVSQTGQRCPARTRLEYDHVDPVARGGQATVAGIRLRCRSHNQFEAERTFGTEFMRHKRQEAQRRATETRARTAATTEPAPQREMTPEPDVAPWLRQLGFRAEEVRRAAALCAAIPDASLEDRVRVAVSSLARGGRHPAIPGA
jgi:hypothetical protein